MAHTEVMAAGFESVQVSGRNSAGVINGFAKLDATDTNTYSGMRRIVGANAFAVQRGKRVKVSPKGDNRALGTFSFVNSDPQELVLTMAEKSYTLLNFLTGLTSATHGGVVSNPGIPASIKSIPAVWLFTRDAIDEDTSAPCYQHYLVFNAGAEENEEAMNYQAEASYGMALTPNESSILPYGLLCADEHGVVKNMYIPLTSENRLTYGVFVGDGTAASFVVHQTPISIAKTTVFVEQTDGTYSEVTPTVVTPSTKTVTVATGDKPAAGKLAIVQFQFQEWS